MNKSIAARLFAGLALVALLAGCATQRIDWAGRIGQYSYDQAVVEFGPPDKQAKLADNTIVAEWLTQRAQPYAYSPYGFGYRHRFRGPFYPDYAEASSPDFFLRLIFGPDGRLSSWKQFAR